MDIVLSEGFLDTIAKSHDEWQRDFFGKKPPQVLKEFKIATEEGSIKPFIKLTNSREFCYWLLSPLAIEKFINKRFDITECIDNFPVLSDEQAETSQQIKTSLNQFLVKADKS